MAKKSRILVCDDDELVHQSVKLCLGKLYEVAHVFNGEEALQHVKTHAVDVLLLDVQMRTPDEGLRYLSQIKKADGDVIILMRSAMTDFGTVVEAMKLGATDYLPKDASPPELSIAIDRALEIRETQLRRHQQNSEVETYHNRHVMVGESKPVEALRQTLKKARNAHANTVITGEPGVGKEVVARLLRGVLPDGSLAPFVSVDSSTIQSTMAESLLFGHEKGAFTGADKTKKGLFEEADGGIIYFDEIGNMPLDIQAKLLRAVQEKEVSRLGSSRTIPLDFRVVCATNRNMDEMVAAKEFRFDLLSRLSVIPIPIPALRDRKSDIPLLVEHFLKKSAVGASYKVLPAAMDMLVRYSWPGNVRELSNVLTFCLTMVEGDTIDVADLPVRIQESQPVVASENPSGSGDFYDQVKEFEKAILTREFARAGHNIAQLSRNLKMDRSHLYAKLRNYGLHTSK